MKLTSNLSVRQSSKREGWMASPEAVAQRALAKPVTSVSPNALSPAGALAHVPISRAGLPGVGFRFYRVERPWHLVSSHAPPRFASMRPNSSLHTKSGRKSEFWPSMFIMA
jgi:hypothetical protein